MKLVVPRRQPTGYKSTQEAVTMPKASRQIVTHEFPPFYDHDSRTLILGSIPSPKSREVGFYYGHPQNRFWKVLAQVFSEDTPETISAKKALLKKHHIALWDVLESCTIIGASDTSIEDAHPNDISFLVKNSKISRIFCTGATAYKLYLYQKYCAANVGLEAIKMPSTSPANCAISMEKLVKTYKVLAE